MSGWSAELALGPVRALWRAGLAWAIGLALIVASTVAFWPAFRGSSGLTQALDQLPSGLVQALGMEDFGTPAGYLRGGLYELIMPLLFAAAAIMLTNSVTASEEDAGRLEIFLAQPIARPAALLGRALAVLAWLVVLTAVTVAVQVGSDAAFGLQIAAPRLGETIALCALLGLLHGSFALALAGCLPRPSLVLSAGFGVVFAGYLVAALFPLSDVLAPWRQISPWEWALGGDPLKHPAETWRYLALAVPAVALTLLGVAGFRRRDIAAA